MAMAEAGGDGFDFPSDPVDRFRLLDLTASKSLLDSEASRTLVCTAAESSIGDVGDAAVTLQVDVNNTSNGVALSLPNSEHSTGKEDPQAPGWTKRYTIVDVSRLVAHSCSTLVDVQRK
ncbi:hypothetical protein VPH35_075406 [Triticum aestivum]